MPSVDADSLLKPISETEPCGPDLRHDGRFMQVLRDAEGSPEDPFNNKAAEDPSWREVRDGCIELLARSRDLRVGVVVVVSEAKLDGFTGLERGLRFLRGCLEQYWDTVHPQLDPEDNNDPLMRANTLAALAAPMGTMGDTVRLLERVRAIPLSDARQLGKFSLEDFALASGALTLPEGSSRSKPEVGLIEAALQETDLEVLQRSQETVDLCVQHAKGVEAAFNSKVKPGLGIDLSALIKMLSDALGHFRRHVGLKTGAPVAGEGGAPAEAGGASVGGLSASGGGPAFSIGGAVRSPKDAAVALDAVCQYYAQAEPSSPVNLIIKCARVCVGKDFLALTALLKPEAVETLRVLSQADQPAPPSTS
ncbi:MAG: type VI secretion system protein TssA [Phycisphaerales bacterium]|nr:type VI secretion system protein TssA [Phycisphaerales bacterium]